MVSQSLQPGAYEAQHAQANRAELAERIARAIPDDGRVEPLTGLSLHRSSASPGSCMACPSRRSV